MTRDGSFDPEDQNAREVAAEAGQDHEEFLSLLPHYYRGEVGQMSTHLSRLDLTTDWAIALLTAVLALSFGSVDSPPYFILLGMLALIMFLLFDVRRYRTYDATRSRVRLIEENVFANAFDPSGTIHRNWRGELGDDLRKPTLKVSRLEALSRRLRRVYLPLLTVLLLAWLFRITVFVSGENPLETAAIPGIPGAVVVGIVTAVYLGALLLALWPTSREAKGEFHGEEPGEWKTEE
ncbi:DUF2270 domain-containing protein [Salarchaeum sp. JOR-1]|uniref:DUF2270 domain-containing protein n=1 Tax=Salarchaeum sp. JOR-1 TaxID=2599399 RepID=UPI00119838FC|nr:DUF2270 domain-containing protein [Salarchaeum sp. JOR-1]QDX39935.1 DUF2270 domain-containing protein [Salarchaeum sp. JOR-1]